jgi:hypothetical protein
MSFSFQVQIVPVEPTYAKAPGKPTGKAASRASGVGKYPRKFGSPGLVERYDISILA